MKTLISTLLLTLALFSCERNQTQSYDKWMHYGGTKDASRYSSLTEINRENVQSLKVLWEYRSGDATEKSQIQCQPIVVDSLVYATTPQLNLVALHVATGKEVWRFDPLSVLGGENSVAGTNRGLAYYPGEPGGRIFFGAGSYLLCVNAQTGKAILGFGDGGKVDLQAGLSDDPRRKFFVVSNTPGIIYKDKIIVGMRLSEGLDAAPGYVRAYNVHTGKQEWVFHTIPKKGEVGYDTWDAQYIDQIGGANNWAGMSLDEERGIVFVPTGSATYDFWGGYRKGDNLFANSLIALDAQTGKRIWHYQVVHHDVWDRDLPANPNLVTINKGGKKIDAVAQITKHGFVYMFERETGKPIFPIDEMAIPPSKMEGEFGSDTQPIPTLPEPFARQTIEKNDILNLTPELHKEALALFGDADYGNMWLSPQHQKPFVLLPGFDGGAEWGGAAVDPETGIMYVNSNEMPWLVEMKKNEAGGEQMDGSGLYANNCANCHGADRKGSGSFPSLINLQSKYKRPEVLSILKSGRGGMPSYAHLSVAERNAIAKFLLGIEDLSSKKELGEGGTKLTSPYLMNGYKRMLTKAGYPAINPPWGNLNAIDLNTGKIIWRSVLGEFPELTARGFPITGRENYGGPVVTKGGLVFIAATEDEMIRAFDKQTGELLWQHKLPAGGHATPAVYQWKGKQYIVIACGGGKSDKSGDSYVAFGLP